MAELIVGYRDDPDLQNLIDTIQADVSVIVEVEIEYNHTQFLCIYYGTKLS